MTDTIVMPRGGQGRNEGAVHKCCSGERLSINVFTGSLVRQSSFALLLWGTNKQPVITKFHLKFKCPRASDDLNKIVSKVVGMCALLTHLPMKVGQICVLQCLVNGDTVFRMENQLGR